jgi:hypothetical protein
MPSEALGRLEIRETQARYGRCIDRQRWEEFGRLFTDDALVEYPDGPLEGREEVEDYARENIEYEFSVHTSQAPIIDVKDDTATGEWYMVVFYESIDGDVGWVLGTYDAEYRYVDGSWLFDYLDAELAYDTAGWHTDG